MKYFKIYKQCARVAKAYVPLTFEQFAKEINNNLDVPEVEDDEEFEILTGTLFQEAEEQTKYSGLDCGDFYLYQRRDDFDMYDIAREMR